MIPIDNPNDPQLQAYRATRDADLLREQNLFMAEGRFIVRLLLGGGCRYSPNSLLVTQPALDSLTDVLGAMSDKPIYLVPQEIMNGITGFNIHRGCIAVCDRGPNLDAEKLLRSIPPGPATLCILEDLANHDNVGGIFRNAAAFGCAGVLLSESCCDPLYRKAIRVSMGGCLTVPFTRLRIDSTRQMLHALGFRIVALALRDNAVNISDAAELLRGRVALMLGAEGPGLTDEALAAADAVVRIPINRGPGAVDSLNVAVATGIALHQCSRRL
ncbi:MAG TPA: RNA methyltransferase [Phycisphaerales bacterium]|nr:RNA methyltransferase [Phycisphaerales bacterium]